MAKTVFGIPGVGDKPAGGGDSVAPGGTPGAKVGGDLPQKSSQEQSSAKEQKPVKPGLNLSGSLADKAKGPAMAKPMAAPIAKPVAPSEAAGAASPAGGKTMFGMPAMKIPGVPDLSELQKQEPVAAATEPPADPAPAVAPAAGAAYNATVLGMAPGALEPEDNNDAQERTTSASAAQSEDVAAAPPMSEPEPAAAMPEEPRNDSYAPAKKSPPWIMIGIGALIVVVLVVVAWVVFGSSGEASNPAPAAPTVPAAGVAPVAPKAAAPVPAPVPAPAPAP